MLLCLIILTHDEAAAKTETIYASYKYVMGDNDTKNDAKRICFMEAKRLLIEKAGVFIESETAVTDFKLTRDEIKTYSAAIVKVEVANEELKFNGDTQTISMTVKADIDTDEVQKMLASIKKDKSLQKKIIEQQEQLKDMENRLSKLHDSLKTVSPEDAIVLRKERNVIFKEMSESEKIVFNIKATTQRAVDNVEVRMTSEEVGKIAGKPRSTAYYTNGLSSWNYGNVWIVFENGIVGCIVNANAFYSGFSCRTYNSKDIVKK